MLFAALALLAGWSGAGLGQEAPVVTSAAPERVALTVYRAPDRAPDDAIDPQARDQQGYALVTETRTVSIPAGPATLRFEGVAGDIFAETAIVTGLPPGIAERNMDADLLSPRTLYDRALGRRVLDPPHQPGDRRGERGAGDDPLGRGRRRRSPDLQRGTRDCAARACPRRSSSRACRRGWSRGRRCRFAPRRHARLRRRSPCPISPAGSTGRRTMS